MFNKEKFPYAKTAYYAAILWRNQSHQEVGLPILTSNAWKSNPLKKSLSPSPSIHLHVINGVELQAFTMAQNNWKISPNLALDCIMTGTCQRVPQHIMKSQALKGPQTRQDKFKNAIFTEKPQSGQKRVPNSIHRTSVGIHFLLAWISSIGQWMDSLSRSDYSRFLFCAFWSDFWPEKDTSKSSVRFSNLNFQVDVVVTIVSEFDSGENKSNWLVGDKTVFYGGGDDQG